jgi:chromosome partitioning protein
MLAVAVANQKGGVGKTSCAVHLAADCALQGLRTLLVDGDPQANATLYFMPEEEVVVGLDDIMVRRGKEQLADIPTAEVPTAIENLSLVPSRITLASYDHEGHLSVTRLRNALDKVRDRYDICFIDTPPTLGKLLSAALAACDYVLIPCQSEPHAIKGLNDLLNVVDGAREVNPRIQIVGACITMHDMRTNIAEAIRSKLKNHFEEYTFDSVIRKRVGLVECSTEHKPIQIYDPKSDAASDYHTLAVELLGRLGVNTPAAATA